MRGILCVGDTARIVLLRGLLLSSAVSVMTIGAMSETVKGHGVNDVSCRYVSMCLL